MDTVREMTCVPYMVVSLIKGFSNNQFQTNPGGGTRWAIIYMAPHEPK